MLGLYSGDQSKFWISGDVGWSHMGPVGCGKTITNTTRSRCLCVNINETGGREYADEDYLIKAYLVFLLLFDQSLEGHKVQFTAHDGIVC